MSTGLYNITQQTLSTSQEFSVEDLSLLDSFSVNSSFNPDEDFIEVNFFTLDGAFLRSDRNYNQFSFRLDSESAKNKEASVVYFGIENDLILYGFDRSDVVIKYNYLSNLFSTQNTVDDFFIETISEDRTELRLESLKLQDSVLPVGVDKALNLFSQPNLTQLYLYKGSNLFIPFVNIKVENYEQGLAVVVKLYEPLSSSYKVKDTFSLVEKIADSTEFTVRYTPVVQPPTVPVLRGPNFDLEVDNNLSQPSQYLSYNELFSYPVTNTYTQAESLFNEKSVEIALDYSNFSEFINFSSAEERLRNFKYKLDLIQNYQNQLVLLENTTQSNQGTSGSRLHFENLIKGITNNFDYYEKHLYFESGSSSWPKVDNIKPYENQASTTLESTNWYQDRLQAAENYDDSNYNSLISVVPEYIKDDIANNPYLLFVQMIGQHFDNIWVYAKAVSDKYNADNRLNKGVSKDLIEEVLKNFGIKLYTSNTSIQDLFKYFTQGTSLLENGEIIQTNVSVDNTISLKDYQSEIYKRIYHNLPLLLKSKGTERGLRALISCFGIPSSVLSIRMKGGENPGESFYLGGEELVTGSLDKIRLDNTGSMASGSTLSQYTSIYTPQQKYTQDLHLIEVGFSPSDNIDKYIYQELSGSFNIDEYIGDPRQSYLSSYNSLVSFAQSTLENVTSYDLKDYVRLIKFFDNVLFKMIVDFIPARNVEATGITIKPHALERSKVKHISGSAIQPQYSASIPGMNIEGNWGGSFRSGSTSMNVSYVETVQTPTGVKPKAYTGDPSRPSAFARNNEIGKFDGILRGSTLVTQTGELNRDNPFKKIQYPAVYYDVVFIENSPTSICLLSAPASTRFAFSGETINLSSLFENTNSSTTYTVNSVPVSGMGTSVSYTFAGNQYVAFTVQASIASLGPTCVATRTVKIVGCSLSVNLSTYPGTVTSGQTYDITSWFNTGVNTNVTYTVGGNIVSNPTAYTFTGVSGQSIPVVVYDNIKTSCTTQVSPIFTSCALSAPLIPIALDGSTIDITSLFIGLQPGATYKFFVYNRTGNPPVNGAAGTTVIVGTETTFPFTTSGIQSAYSIVGIFSSITFTATNFAGCSATSRVLTLGVAPPNPTVNRITLGFDTLDPQAAVTKALTAPVNRYIVGTASSNLDTIAQRTPTELLYMDTSGNELAGSPGNRGVGYYADSFGNLWYYSTANTWVDTSLFEPLEFA